MKKGFIKRRYTLEKTFYGFWRLEFEDGAFFDFKTKKEAELYLLKIK